MIVPSAQERFTFVRPLGDANAGAVRRGNDNSVSRASNVMRIAWTALEGGAAAIHAEVLDCAEALKVP